MSTATVLMMPVDCACGAAWIARCSLRSEHDRAPPPDYFARPAELRLVSHVVAQKAYLQKNTPQHTGLAGCFLRRRRTRDSNPQPLAGYLSSSEAAHQFAYPPSDWPYFARYGALGQCRVIKRFSRGASALAAADSSPPCLSRYPREDSVFTALVRSRDCQCCDLRTTGSDRVDVAVDDVLEQFLATALVGPRVTFLQHQCFKLGEIRCPRFDMAAQIAVPAAVSL